MITEIPLTITELATLYLRLDDPHLHPTRRQLRSWCLAFEIGIGKSTSAHNGAHLYTAADLAITRLIARMRRRRVPPRAIWALMVMQRAELRAALNIRPYPIVWIEPSGCPHILALTEGRLKPRRECFPLRDVVYGIRRAIDELRAESPTVWNGAARVPVAALTPTNANADQYPVALTS